MESIIKLIEHNGVTIVLSGLVIFFVYKFVNKSLNKTSCILLPEFKKLAEDIIEIKIKQRDIKDLLTAIMTTKYQGRNDK
jgi:hypothetical protein